MGSIEKEVFCEGDLSGIPGYHTQIMERNLLGVDYELLVLAAWCYSYYY
jgi:hypothetical protein